MFLTSFDGRIILYFHDVSFSSFYETEVVDFFKLNHETGFRWATSGHSIFRHFRCNLFTFHSLRFHLQHGHGKERVASSTK